MFNYDDNNRGHANYPKRQEDLLFVREFWIRLGRLTVFLDSFQLGAGQGSSLHASQFRREVCFQVRL